MVMINRATTTPFDSFVLAKKLMQYSVGDAIDYRHVATFVHASSISLGGGDLICLAETGFSATAPRGRNARIPGSLNAHAVSRSDGNRAECEIAAALGAIEQLMKDPWVGRRARMNGFERTREDGAALPDLKQMAAVQKRLSVASTVPRAAPVKGLQGTPSKAETRIEAPDSVAEMNRAVEARARQNQKNLADKDLTHELASFIAEKGHRP